MSLGRTHEWSRSATWMSSRSPAAWPRLSLTSLKPSRSRKRTATEGVCRFAPFSVARLERHALPPSIAWPALGIGMVAGWALAAWQPAALLVARSLSGMCMSALEGDTDARSPPATPPRAASPPASPAPPPSGPSASATAVALAPPVIAGNGVGALSVALVTVLAAAMVVILTWRRSQWTLSGTGPAANPG